MTAPTQERDRPSASGRGAVFFAIVASPAARLPLAVLASLVVGAMVRIFDATLSDRVWLLALVLTGAPVTWKTLRGLFGGHFAADVVAMLAIVTAVVLRQPIAGLVIVLMQTGGELLDAYAEGRASDAVRELERAAPRVAHRVRGETTEDIEADAIVPGDLLLVRPGEMVACDGIIADGASHIDVARLTGEPSPEFVTAGSVVRSGSVNQESAFRLRATAPARDSLYARIVELVRSAQAEKSPIQRLADRYAIWFTPVTIVACALAWFLSGDALRVLAVLVVATPCPLILATPVAIISGINRAARHQIIVRTGSALEQIGSVDAAVFDKTGTLTIGYPELSELRPADGFDEATLLSLTAGVEHASGHLLARTTVLAAQARGLRVPEARDSIETPGRGISGTVEGRRVSVGSLRYVAATQPNAASGLAALHEEGAGLRAYVAVDGAAAGELRYADHAREGLPAFFARLKTFGVNRTVLLSGDHEKNVAEIARALGISEARGDMLPDQKVAVVKELLAAGHKVLMTGDGTNDAPALSAATVGIALAAHGGGITAEAADIVLLADDVTRVADAIAIGRRATQIARQSIFAGLLLSGAAMVVAALGYIPPTIGALLQEAIDIAVILNALRAGTGPASDIP